MSTPVVLINMFEVPPGMESAFVAWWQHSSDALKREPGFIDAHLHRCLKPNASFQFINIAHWETAAALDLARSKHAELLHAPPTTRGYPALYEVAARY